MLSRTKAGQALIDLAEAARAESIERLTVAYRLPKEPAAAPVPIRS